MNRSGSERGQTLVLFSLFLSALLGISALVIDVGFWYQQKRSLQSAADAGALAGAVSLPVGWSSATSTAAGEFGKNSALGSASYQQASTFVSGDSILVTASQPAPGFFAKVLGHASITISATAKATMVNSGGGALPWAVMQKPYVPGTSYPIYTDNRGPNNGAVRLAAQSSPGSPCSASGGDSLYRAEIAGGSVTTCPVQLNDVLTTKTGQNAGPTTQGVGDRCTSLQPASSIVTFTADGTPTLLQPDSCQLVLLPVVVDASTGAPTWPTTGSGDVKVVGFSWWVVTAVTQGGKEVDAVYIGNAPTDPSAAGPLPSAYHAQLTG
jgi:Flp pilus assembly protein TadG